MLQGAEPGKESGCWGLGSAGGGLGTGQGQRPLLPGWLAENSRRKGIGASENPL